MPGPLPAAASLAPNEPMLSTGLTISPFAGTLALVLALAVAGTVFAMVRKQPWPMNARLVFAGLSASAVGYLAMVLLMAMPLVPLAMQPLSWLLFAAQGASLVMACAYSFYSIDAATRKIWLRHADKAPFEASFKPAVAFHVPLYNEPPEMVVDTLQRLLKMDYPATKFQIVVVDDSTNPDLWKPIEAFCQESGITFCHRADRSGYKAGALNEAMRLTAPEVEIVAVLDADFQVQADFLKETVGYFTDPEIGFVQTAQDYRNAHQSFLAKQYRNADRYFYQAVLPSRNEANAIIFCGTMGLLRRSALEAVGGWLEGSVAEDLDLSIRLVHAGQRSMYVTKVYGRGLTPYTFEAFRKQHYRWAFGGVQVLREHYRKLLRGPLSLRQKMDFLVGSLHWFDGVYLLMLASILLLLGISVALGSVLVTYQAMEVGVLSLLALVPFLHSLVRIHLALRRALGLRLSQTIGVLGIWLSVKTIIAGAAVRALTSPGIVFARTPKAPDSPLTRPQAVVRALRVAPLESALALALLFTAFANLPGAMHDLRVAMLIVALMSYAAIYAQAPTFAFLSYTTLVPMEASPPLQDRWRAPVGQPPALAGPIAVQAGARGEANVLAGQQGVLSPLPSGR